MPVSPDPSTPAHSFPMRFKRRSHGPPLPKALHTVSAEPDGSVNPVSADAATLAAANDYRQWDQERREWAKGSPAAEKRRREAALQAKALNPSHAEQLAYLLQLSGASGEDSRWGDLFDRISTQESPGMALYCLYVAMGWPELTAYHAVFGTAAKGSGVISPAWSRRARPFIIALLTRLMPSRTRLLMHMEDLMSNPKVDAAVRANMMQWLGKYLLEEPVVSAAAGADGTPSEPKHYGSVQALVQDHILKRGGVLFIPPEAALIEGEQLGKTEE